MNDAPSDKPVAAEHPPDEHQRGLLTWWHRKPLYARILGALVLGALVGAILGDRSAFLAVPSRLILRLLAALAPPLILLAVVRVLMGPTVKGRTAGRLACLLILNTLVAIAIGLTVANIIQPGKGAAFQAPDAEPAVVSSNDPMAPRIAAILKELGVETRVERPPDPLTQFLENIPKSLLGPLSDNGSVLGVIFLAVAFGIVFRRLRERPIRNIEDAVNLGFDALLVILHWIIDLVPIGVFGIVASVVGTQGLEPFLALVWLVVAVLIALSLQAVYYLVRIRWRSWVRPVHVLRGTRDALVMAFSTASSTATMPVTYECLRERVGLREESASMGALVGANFNNDGTALYEAMAALFVSQLAAVDMPLDLAQQAILVLTSIIASVGAAGIPEAGLVTMTLVFTAIGLPLWPIPLLLTVDWFLDRCRTTINVLGDINVSCILDGRVAPQASLPAAADTADEVPPTHASSADAGTPPAAASAADE
jgi:DAACS family dicarboxylate/amino acid:cation (Na+ or H+) symporter